MASYTVLTVFENTDTINEPVISLPVIGKVSFRQIGMIVGLAILLPMGIYSGASDGILHVLPDPVFTFVAVNSEIRVTWDVIIAMVPVPIGLVLGVPRPKLVPMDRLIIILVKFSMYHTSVKSVLKEKKTKKSKAQSKYEGFARQAEVRPGTKAKSTHAVSVTDLGIPKNITITVYDLDGVPLRRRLARAYVDDVLLCSITTDADGVMGMTFVPKKEGIKNLRIMADGIRDPVVDVALDVKRSR